MILQDFSHLFPLVTRSCRQEIFILTLLAFQASYSYTIRKQLFFAIDHRTLKKGLPVRSAVLKQCAVRLVVGWVTTSESLMLIVFATLCFLCGETDWLLLRYGSSFTGAHHIRMAESVSFAVKFQFAQVLLPFGTKSFTSWDESVNPRASRSSLRRAVRSVDIRATTLSKS
jgi:hypothetical protein